MYHAPAPTHARADTPDRVLRSETTRPTAWVVFEQMFYFEIKNSNKCSNKPIP